MTSEPAASDPALDDHALGDHALGDAVARPPPAGLLEWARRPGPRLVLEEARRRAEAGTLGARGVLQVELSDVARHEVGVLLGVTWQTAGKALRIDALRRRLAREGVAVEDLLVAVGGPLRNRQAERMALAAERSREDDAARAELAAVLPAGLLESVVSSCLPPASSGERLRRAAQLALVCSSLPGPAESTGLPVLATRCFGDAHALDRGTPLGRSAARLAHLLAGPPTADTTGTAAGWRAAWEGVGILCDGLSSMVLTLNLPLNGDAAAVAQVRASPGEPVWLTARALRGSVTLIPHRVQGVPNVFVCENPSVVEAAAGRWGADCKPLVCTYGKPSVATMTLLRALSASGALLRLRADADPAGRAIVASLLAELDGAVAWRYGADTPTYEEELIDVLLGDLAPGLTHGR